MKKHKKYIRNIIYCMAAAFICSSVSIAAVKFTLSRSNVNVTEGNKISVKYLAPGKVKVKSSKKRTAKASIKRKYIVIKGIEPGAAVIKVTYKRKTKHIKVIVKKKDSVLSSSLQVITSAPGNFQAVQNTFGVVSSADSVGPCDGVSDNLTPSMPKTTETPPANAPAATYPPVQASSSPVPSKPPEETPAASPEPDCQSTAQPAIPPENTP